MIESKDTAKEERVLPSPSAPGTTTQPASGMGRAEEVQTRAAHPAHIKLTRTVGQALGTESRDDKPAPARFPRTGHRFLELERDGERIFCHVVRRRIVIATLLRDNGTVAREWKAW